MNIYKDNNVFVIGHFIRIHYASGRAVVDACALQRHSTRASGKRTTEKYNCVIWSRQAEVAVPVF